VSGRRTGVGSSVGGGGGPKKFGAAEPTTLLDDSDDFNAAPAAAATKHRAAPAASSQQTSTKPLSDSLPPKDPSNAAPAYTNQGGGGITTPRDLSVGVGGGGGTTHRSTGGVSTPRSAGSVALTPGGCHSIGCMDHIGRRQLNRVLTCKIT
jgi:hypothetical protein